MNIRLILFNSKVSHTCPAFFQYSQTIFRIETLRTDSIALVLCAFCRRNIFFYQFNCHRKMKVIRKHSRTLILISLLAIFLIIAKRESFISHYNRLARKPNTDNSSFAPLSRDNYPFVTNFDRIDWTDYAFMEYEANRTGPGENGAGITLTDPKEIEQNEKLKKIEGLCALCSDKIDVNRSVLDTRPER